MKIRRVAQALAGAILAATVITSGATPAIAAKGGPANSTGHSTGHGAVHGPKDTGWGFI